MKVILFFLTFSVLVLTGYTQTIDPSKYSAPIKVACIGNSITNVNVILNRP